MDCGSIPAAGDRINSFSLVSYIEGRLGQFLNKLRTELVCECTALSHVTVLPPRTLAISAEEAAAQLRPRLAEFHAFGAEIAGIRIFSGSDVIYADISFGRGELIAMHDKLNQNDLRSEEVFEYHPHITLAQKLAPQDVRAAAEVAQRRWDEARLPRSFEVSTLTFVQNTIQDRWVDLEAYALKGEPSVRHSR